MAHIEFLEKLVKLCFVKPIIIEIWDNKDYHAHRLKPYVKYVKSHLQIRHPEIEMLSTTRTNILRNFDHPLLAGNYWGYVIKVSPNIDACKLKKTCIELEQDCLGNRMADIDVYISWKKKVSRHNLMAYGNLQKPL